MKRRRPAVEIALGVVAVALLGAFMIPLRVPEVAAPPLQAHHEEPEAAKGVEAVASSDPDAAAVAALFGAWQRPTAPARAAPPPQTAAWLHYLAFAVDSSGRTEYFFKNDQSGQVLMLAVGAANGGWRLVSVSNGSFLLDRGGTRYLVKAGSP